MQGGIGNVRHDSLHVVQLNKSIQGLKVELDSLIDSTNLFDSLLKSSRDSIESILIQNNVLGDSLVSIINSTKEAPEVEVFGMPVSLARIFIPVVVSILIFALGQFLIWLKKKYEKQSEVKSYRYLILDWISLIKTPVEAQIEACNVFADTVRKSDTIHPELFKYNKMMADKIADLSVEKYVNTFVVNCIGKNQEAENNKRKFCFGLIASFSFLKRIEEQIPNIYEKYERETFTMMDEWNESFQLLESTISNHSRLINGNPSHKTKAFHQKIIQIKDTWSFEAAKGQKGISFVLNNLIKPLLSCCDSELKKNPTNDYAHNLLTILIKLSFINYKWSIYKDGIAKRFDTLGDSIKKVMSDLEIVRTKLDANTRVSRVFWIK